MDDLENLPVDNSSKPEPSDNEIITAFLGESEKPKKDDGWKDMGKWKLI